MAKRDDFRRIYQDCQSHPLFQAMLAMVDQGKPYTKTRNKDLYLYADDTLFNPGGLKHIQKFGLHFELLSDIESIKLAMNEDYDSEFGPRLATVGPGNISLTRSYILDFNCDAELFMGKFKLQEFDDWDDTGLARAARAYRRECHWDFSPGDAGIWVCYYVPSDATGGNGDWWYNGNLAGFLILYDHNEDGEYESIGHIWTAKAARRRGIASALVAHARKEYGVQKVEGPVTKDGKLLFTKAWPEALNRK
jgi:ribosomal protein S18 acetylase RimI-like enzyme